MVLTNKSPNLTLTHVNRNHAISSKPDLVNRLPKQHDNALFRSLGRNKCHNTAQNTLADDSEDSLSGFWPHMADYAGKYSTIQISNHRNSIGIFYKQPSKFTWTVYLMLSNIPWICRLIIWSSVCLSAVYERIKFQHQTTAISHSRYYLLPIYNFTAVTSRPLLCLNRDDQEWGIHYHRRLRSAWQSSVLLVDSFSDAFVWRHTNRLERRLT